MKTRSVTIVLTMLFVLVLMVQSASASLTIPRHDFTETFNPPTQTDYIVVTFQDPPAASYMGGIPGLTRTRPEQGQRLNPNSQAVRGYVAHLAQGHQAFRDFLSRQAPQAEITGEFFYASNGVAVKSNGARLQALKNGPGVRTADYSVLYQPTMNVSTGLIGASDLWPLAGGRENAGAGIKVGIIDSGIDETHDFFACKDQIVHKVYASGVAFDPGNLLVNEHGTHVAGTVAGCVITLSDGPIQGVISGIAPAAALYDYNVFPGFGGGYVAFGGSAFSHDIAEALEDAVVDGMDVVNMSLSGGVQGPHDFLAEAVDAAVDAGMVVAVAAGNSGPGDSTVGSPGSAPNALTAGASTNPHFIGISVQVTGGGSYGAALGDFNNFVPPITADYTATTPANGCTAISEDLTGKIAVIVRGTCSFTTKIRNAQNAGAVGVLVVNNVAGDPIAMGHDGTSPFPTIPAAMLGKNEGSALGASGNVTVDGTTVSEILTSNADILAGFSSHGPTPYTYLIKPDLVAPGVNIYSSVFGNEFAMFQGTSMATPHLTGSTALLLALHPDWSPADVKSALANNAARVVTDPFTGTMDPGVMARGGGRVDLVAANSTPVTLDPVSVSFGYWSGSRTVTSSMDVTVKNVSPGSVSCSVSVTGPGMTSVSPAGVSLGVGESTSVTVSLNAGGSNQTPSGDYDGDVVLDCGGTTLLAPWWVRINRQARP